MIKVLEAISDTNIGGAGILLATRCAHTKKNKYEMIVAMPKGSALKQRIQQSGAAVIEVDGCYDRSLEWRSVIQWIVILQKIRPRIVNCHGCLSCRIAARLCGVPALIDTRHCAFDPQKWMTVFPGKYIVGTMLNHLSDHTIAVAEAAKRNLLDIGVDPQKIHVIINGAEQINRLDMKERERLRRELSIPKRARVVSMFARLERCKDHRTFLRAAKILLQGNRNYHFLIVGDGKEKRELQQYAHALGIEKFVSFIGFVLDVTPYFNVTDIQVNCSIGTETSSLALSEGMSLGIPAVASSFGGNPYMVRNGENGFLFPIGRADLLAERIHQITADPALYQRLSVGARDRFFAELNAERMTDQTLSLYDSALQHLTHTPHA